MSQTESPWTCPKCKAENDPDFTHCRMCGEQSPTLEGRQRVCPKCGILAGRQHDCCPVCGSPYFAQH